MEMKTHVLNSILQSLKYMPYVFTQVNTGAIGEYIIRYPHREVPDNSLLFMLPTRNAHPTINKLILLLPNVQRDDTGNTTITYNNDDRIEYNIIMEHNDGTMRNAREFSIIANRLALFRFIKGDKDTVVLTNNPNFNDINISTLLVNNNAVFRQKPIYSPDPNDSSKDAEIVTADQYNALLKRVEDLEKMFVFGDQDPQEALADKPDGTIYVKVEKY